MKSRGFFIQEYWYWIGLSAQAMYTFLFNIGFTLALAYLNRKHSRNVIDIYRSNSLNFQKQSCLNYCLYFFLALEKTQAVVPEEGVKENHARRREESVENQQRAKHSGRSMLGWIKHV